MRYRLTHGGHVSGTGDSLCFHDQGSIVDSPVDLAERYPEKFERLPEHLQGERPGERPAETRKPESIQKAK